MEIQNDAVLSPWTNPMEFCTLGKLVREHLGTILACPSCVSLCGRHPDHGLELPGSPHTRTQEVSGRDDVRGAAPRATLVLVENPKHDRKSCSRYERLRGAEM